MEASIHPLTRADGSALFSLGDSTYMASVYGPQRLRRRGKICTLESKIRVIYKTKSGRRGYPFRRSIEKHIRTLLNSMVIRDNHPRTYIRVSLFEFHTQVSIVASIANAVNATCLAALDSGIAMTYQVAAVVVAVMTPPVVDASKPHRDFKKPDYEAEGYEVTVNPSREQAERATFEAMFSFENHVGEMVSTHTLGTCTSDQYERCFGLAKAAAIPIFAMYRDLVMARFRKLLPRADQ